MRRERGQTDTERVERGIEMKRGKRVIDVDGKITKGVEREIQRGKRDGER